jgi:hypothetical protein
MQSFYGYRRTTIWLLGKFSAPLLTGDVLMRKFLFCARITKLNQIERRLKIPSVKRDTTRTRPHEETVQAIIDEAEKDVSQNNGLRFIKDKLKDKLIMVPR